MADIFEILAKTEKQPTDLIGLSDNLDLLIVYIKGMFETIALATEDQINGISHVADLGIVLADEALARAEALYTYAKTHQPETEED